ncbi:PH domain-containing protein [Promicromonospora panici]|uniref:PH domain-containing protein n=1 Tax=Promicromonospora panici TaxID=2219658 RepID=UPI00101D555D|nr:PH domain-containing protein [Promicromonospora panici]
MSATADFVVPHRALQRYILANEKVIIATHRHWGMLWEPILTTAGAFVLAVGLLVAVDPNVRDALGWVWLPFVVLGARLLYKWLEWRARWFVMTDRRLLLLDGFLVHRVAMMPSEKVTDLGYERTPMGQLLGYGTFIFETAGQDQALDRVTWIPRPDSRYRLIIASLFHPDAADAEAAAQANPDVRPQAVPSTDSPSPAPPPALMPRIGRRSNPPTQRIELPIARGGAAPDSAAEESTAKDTTSPGSEEPTGVTWAATGGATAGDAAPASGDAADQTWADQARTARARDAGGEHVPGGPTADRDPTEVRPEPFIEGGKDPKMR